MNGDSSLIVILVTGILTGNVVLSRFLGICPFLGVSKKLDSAFSMGIAVTLVLMMSTAVTYPVYYGLLLPNGLKYMQTVVFILIIAALVQLVEIVLKKFIPPIYRALGIYLPLITTNCAVLGIAIMNTDNGFGFGQSVINAFASGVGFTLAMIMFAGIRSKIEKSDIPPFLRGLPITLTAASITALSFLGFSGII